MQLRVLKHYLRRRNLLAALCGVVWAGAFPNLGIAGAAWLVPALLLITTAGLQPKQTFRTGYFAGFIFHSLAFYWLLHMPVPAGAFFGWIALSAFLSLYPAVWVLICWRVYPDAPRSQALAPAYGKREDTGRLAALFPQYSPQSTTVLSAQQGMAGRYGELLHRLLSIGRGQRVLWALFCAVSWVALEMIRGRLFTGMPWNLLGASQYRMPVVTQIASITGVYGVSFLIVWISVSLAFALALIVWRPSERWEWRKELMLPSIALTLVLLFGFRGLIQPNSSDRTLKIALIQPSIPQVMIWDPKEIPRRFSKLMQLTELAVTTKPDVIAWPEASLPGINEEQFRQITNLVIRSGAWMAIGADDAELKPDAKSNRDFYYYNSAFLINPQGHIAATYRKRQLVMFGEYIPFAKWIPFIQRILPIGEGFTAGKAPAEFRCEELNVTFAPSICFEDIFPHVTRTSVEDDTDFLLNLTNNGWFGESAAQWQHAAGASFRAIENGVPLVRCANNGLSCWVDTRGIIHEVDFEHPKDVYGPGFKTAHIPVSGTKHSPTFYRAHGDVFGWSCVVVTVLVFAFSLRRPVEVKTAPPRA